MPFRPPGPRRERILAMGVAGSGKTGMWLSIAKRYEQLKTPGTFYVMDTDLSLSAMLSGDRFGSLYERAQWIDWAEQPNGSLQAVPRNEVENPRIVIFEPYEWPEYMESMNYIKAHQTNDDWMVIDLHNPSWSAVQDYYIDLIHKKESTEFYLSARSAGKNGNPLDGDKDWSNINRLYRDFVGPIARARGHVFLCTAVKQVQTEGGRVDAKDVRVTFGAHGVKPEGQKMTHHMVHTVIMCSEFRPGEYIWTTVKDREREDMVGQPANDFAMDYLVGKGGWKLA